MFVKNIINIDDVDNDNDDDNSSFDRRCILFILVSDVERNASKGLRVFSSKRKKKKKRNENSYNEILIDINPEYR